MQYTLSKLNDTAIIENEFVKLPISHYYSLTYENKLSANSIRGEYYTGYKKFVTPIYSETLDAEIISFALNPDNDSAIQTLVEHQDQIDFLAIKLSSVILLNSPTFIKGEEYMSGDALKEMLLANDSIKAAYKEIEIRREAVLEERRKQIKENNETKLEGFYHQWEWLEKKRLNGEFDFMIEKLKQDV